MKVEQLKWENNCWTSQKEVSKIEPQLCLLFGTRETIEEQEEHYKELRKRYASAQIVVTSTAGNIFGEELLDDVIIATCIQFNYTEVDTISMSFENRTGLEIGESLGEKINGDETAYVLLLCTSGINVGNLLKGLNEKLEGKISVSGGVAGDNYKFEKTLVGLNGEVGENRLVAVVFKGDRLSTYHGSKGGWDTFGPARKVTKSDGNILYEIDGKPALELYKTYLGDKSNELPGAALHFPLAIVDPKTKEYIVRGVQNTMGEENALVLFGDVKENDTIQLMKANFDRVIEGAVDSAKQASSIDLGEPDFSILISCVARRLVLDQLVEEELSEARNFLGKKTTICGFYSYSELSPVVGDDACHLHNQTMTITSFYEK